MGHHVVTAPFPDRGDRGDRRDIVDDVGLIVTGDLGVGQLVAGVVGNRRRIKRQGHGSVQARHIPTRDRNVVRVSGRDWTKAGYSAGGARYGKVRAIDAAHLFVKIHTKRDAVGVGAAIGGGLPENVGDIRRHTVNLDLCEPCVIRFGCKNDSIIAGSIFDGREVHIYKAQINRANNHPSSI